MGVQGLETFSEPRKKNEWWIFPKRNMEEAMRVLSDQKHLETVKNVDKDMVVVVNDRKNLKATRQTVLKMSCDSNMEASLDSKSMKEDRILNSLVYGQEKGDVSKEDLGNLSLDWQPRVVNLYEKGIKIKTEEGVLGLENKSPEIWQSVKDIDIAPNVHKNRSMDFSMKCKKMNDSKFDKNVSEQIPLEKSTLEKDDLNKKKIKIDSNKEEKDVELDQMENDQLNLKEKIYKRKIVHDEENMKLKENKFAEINFDIKTSKNNRNEEQKKREKNISLKDDEAKLNYMKKSPSNVREQNDTNQQETEKEENDKNVDAFSEEQKCSDTEPVVQSSINETNNEQVYPPSKLRNLILLSQDVADEQGKVQKGQAELRVTGCDLYPKEPRNFETPNEDLKEKLETGKMNESEHGTCQ